MVVMPASAMAAAIISGPIVKLRFTGTRPAMSVAMFASAPPTDAGRSRPMRDWPSVRRRAGD
jgi:hypothetical protein